MGKGTPWKRERHARDYLEDIPRGEREQKIGVTGHGTALLYDPV